MCNTKFVADTPCALRKIFQKKSFKSGPMKLNKDLSIFLVLDLVPCSIP
jgi:hypothetical protein